MKKIKAAMRMKDSSITQMNFITSFFFLVHSSLLKSNNNIITHIQQLVIFHYGFLKFGGAKPYKMHIYPIHGITNSSSHIRKQQKLKKKKKSFKI